MVDLFESKQLGNVPYVDEDDNIIILPGIEFRHHYKVQEWINGTDRNADFVIVITHIEQEKDYLKTTVALKPTTARVMFWWKLHGLDKLEQEILDFKPER